MNPLLRVGYFPADFYDRAGRLTPWLWGMTLLLLATGLMGAFLMAPPHHLQGEAYQINYIHLPGVWMAVFIYAVLAGASALFLIRRVRLADVWARVSAPLGTVFTALALATGILRDKAVWGAWWAWDTHLTSLLVLLFLYLGYMALRAAIEDQRIAARAGAILALVGVVNIPVIHYSVIWWNTLHQGPSITRLDILVIHPSMPAPLLMMVFAFILYYVTVALTRARCELLADERATRWAMETVGKAAP